MAKNKHSKARQTAALIERLYQEVVRLRKQLSSLKKKPTRIEVEEDPDWVGHPSNT